MSFPELLEVKNTELASIKKEIVELKAHKKKEKKGFSLDKFKRQQRYLLSHLGLLVTQRDKPELVNLAFALVYG
jgi:hypothetical protein